MLSISENCENSLFLFLANLGICLLCVCMCVCFFLSAVLILFEGKGHLKKLIPKLQSEMSYIKNFLNVVYIFLKALCEIVCTSIS